ncbi:MAG: stage VI sporulation protein D [Bacillus sp. (in: Bacteria)]|nr:stage VI sporulation protein D [Bacillus sp. (in: firmicutes)]
MSQENQSCLRFSLEESLWFRKGQEVEELVSISLDPDITIQENDQYVTIRGSLELTGEYKSYQASDVSEDEGFTSQKFVERVAELEEGNCEFSHRFPVDITIPTNRIESIYDIDVLVESFDYSIPERSCLKLSAELTISGLYEVNQEQEVAPVLEVLPRSETADAVEEEETEVEIEASTVQSSFDDNILFEAEARKQQEEESVEVVPNFPNFSYQPQEEEDANQSSWDYHETRSEGLPPIDFEPEIVVEKAPIENVQYEEDVTIPEESSSSSEEAPPKSIKKKKASKKKAMSLTEFFDRKDEGSDHARVKVCIVQKGDTVDSLADRYDITVQNFLRINNLEVSADVFEGQVLYIPTALAKK